MTAIEARFAELEAERDVLRQRVEELRHPPSDWQLLADNLRAQLAASRKCVAAREAERDEARAGVRQMVMAEAEAMALVLSHEGHIAKLESEVAQLKRWLDDAHLARASEQDEASAQRAASVSERDAALADVAQLRRRLTHATTECFRLRQELAKDDALGEGERHRRPVVCETCDGEGWLHEDPIVDGAVPACPDCGKDGCGPGVRWET